MTNSINAAVSTPINSTVESIEAVFIIVKDVHGYTRFQMVNSRSAAESGLVMPFGVATTPQTLVAPVTPAPVIVEKTPENKPVPVVTETIDVLREKYKTMGGSMKGMHNAGVDTFLRKIAALEAEGKTVPVPTTPAATKKSFRDAAPAAPAAPKQSGWKKKGGKKKDDGEIIKINLEEYEQAIYLGAVTEERPNPKELTVFVIDIDEDDNSRRVFFSPSKRQPEGIAAGYVKGLKWTASKERIVKWL